MRFRYDLDFELKTTYFPLFGVNISQTVCIAVACLALRQLGFLVTSEMSYFSCATETT